MATNNAVNSPLAGTTGTGNFVGANTPTLITPVIGAATGTSLNFGASATDGIKGVTSGSLAAAGVVGEVISSTVASNVVSLTSSVAADITSISLTAGDWNVSGWVYFQQDVTTTAIQFVAAINTTSATIPSTLSPSISNSYARLDGISFAANSTNALSLSNAIINVSSTTTVYLVGRSFFSTSTMTAGGVLIARRVR